MSDDLEHERAPLGAPSSPTEPDPPIPAEEERLLARVLEGLAAHAPAPAAPGERRGYADEMVALRDEIGEARLEDVPALVAQMERLQGVSLTRGDLQTILVDPASPYFGHLRLREEVDGRGAVERDVLIGRATFVDPRRRINIVDWRHAPISQLFYRYEEGSDYEERFGERDVTGEILARRTLTITGGVLTRVASPQGIWARGPRRRLLAAPELVRRDVGPDPAARPPSAARRSTATSRRSRPSSIRASSTSSRRARRASSSSRGARAAARRPWACTVWPGSPTTSRSASRRGGWWS